MAHWRPSTPKHVSPPGPAATPQGGVGARGVDRTLIEDLTLAGLSSVGFVIILYFVFRVSSPSPPDSAALPPVIGELSQQTREVRRRFDGMLVWNDIYRGEAVHDGDGIYVPEGGAATVTLKRGGQIVIDDKSLMVLRPVVNPDGGDAALAIDLLRGGAAGTAGEGKVAIHAAGSAVQLENGSHASVRLRADRSLSVTVPMGSAAVTLRDGGSVRISAHERRVVDGAGTRIGPVEGLGTELAAPAAGARLFIKSRRQDVLFSWSPVGGAEAYVLELGRDAGFVSVVASIRTTETHLGRTGLPSGTYYWRVRTATPLAEQVSEERQLVLMDDTPTSLVRPGVGETIDLSQTLGLTLAWVEVPDVTHYLLELERPGMGWKTTRRTRRATETIDASTGMFHEGNYCARVRVDEPDRGESPWSESTCFVVVTRGVLKAPKLYPPTREGNAPKGRHGALPATPRGTTLGFLWRLVGGTALAAEPALPVPASMILRWEKIPGAAAYLVEIAAVDAFTTVLVSTRTSDNYLRWTPPARQDFFWRVRAIDAEERQGELSEVRRIALAPAAAAPVTVSAPPPLEIVEPRHDRLYVWESTLLNVPLRWHASAGQMADVDVARDRHFHKKVGTFKSSSGSLLFVPPTAGSFFWRVRAHDAAEWSAAATFRVGLATPILEAAKVGAEGIALSWHPVPGATRYTARVWPPAADATVSAEAGTHIVELTGNSGHLEPLPPGTYMWTVRAMDGDGNSSEPARPETLLVPLPPPLTATVVAPPPARAPAAPQTLSLGARAAVYSNFGEVVALRPGAEVGWRAAVLGHAVGLLISGSYYAAGLNVLSTDGTATVHASLYSVPIDMLVVYYVGTDLGPVSASLGVRSALSVSTLSVAGQPPWSTSGWSFGAVAAAGAERDMGPGRMFADVSWAFAPRRIDGGVENDVGGLALTLGYRLFIL